MSKKGLFITFEGTEGTGKTTQLKLLAATLKDKGHDVMVTREPGGTEFGMRIRHILLRSKREMCHESEMLLYMASRAELVRTVLLPNLAVGKTILCDRWVDATIAYQGYGLGLSSAWIKQVAKPVTLGLKPDMTFWLDLPVAKGLQRAQARGELDRIEKRLLSFHKKVYLGYKTLCQENKRIKRVPADTILNTHAAIMKAGKALW